MKKYSLVWALVSLAFVFMKCGISKKLFQRLAKTISNGENYVVMVHHCMALALADSGFLCFHQIARETFPAHCHPHGIDLAHRFEGTAVRRGIWFPHPVG